MDDSEQAIQSLVFDKRPSELATDNARIHEVISYLIKGYSLEEKNNIAPIHVSSADRF